jgi:hypothetical protein
MILPLRRRCKQDPLYYRKVPLPPIRQWDFCCASGLERRVGNTCVRAVRRPAAYWALFSKTMVASMTMGPSPMLRMLWEAPSAV